MKTVFLFLSILLFTVSSCKKENGQVYKIDYSIGCSDCEVIYVSNQTGTQTTEYHQNSNWKYSFNAKKNQEVILLAYNTAGNPQGVTATIKLNDEILQTQTTYCPISGVSFCVDTIR